MIHIKRFIDKVSLIESRQGKDVIIPVAEARGLRDELAKLLADSVEKKEAPSSPETIQVEFIGGKF